MNGPRNTPLAKVFSIHWTLAVSHLALRQTPWDWTALYHGVPVTAGRPGAESAAIALLVTITHDADAVTFEVKEVADDKVTVRVSTAIQFLQVDIPILPMREI